MCRPHGHWRFPGRDAGVESVIHYPEPIHPQVAYRGGVQQPLPHCDRLAKTSLSLPMHPGLSNDEQARVLGALTEWAATREGRYV